jgi:hypothetical protein
MRSFIICTLHHIVWVVKIEGDEMGPIAQMGEMRNVYKILVGKPQRERLLGRPGHR